MPFSRLGGPKEPDIDLSKPGPMVIYVAPQKRLKRYIGRYVVELGNLTIAWNSLHEHLVELFDLVLPSPRKS